MSWSLFCPTWQTAIHFTHLVNRPNFLICLDTFHIATKLWASPYTISGKYPDADRVLAADLDAFLKDFPLDKLAYIQLSDAERFNPPFSTSHPWYTPTEAAEFSWSRHGRPFPLETQYGGYLPLLEMLQTWVRDKGFVGWVSMETFDRRMRDAGVSVEDCAARAQRSCEGLERGLKRVGGSRL
jgi:sugar phosphate isomerase/epimerase